MTLDEYQIQASRTCPDLFQDQDLGTSSFLNTAHMIYGMVSEAAELFESIYTNDIINDKEEIADIMWYVANYCTFNNIKLQDTLVVEAKEFPSRMGVHEAIVILIGELADLEKKELAYKKAFSYEKQMDILQNLVFYIVEFCKRRGISFYEALDKNIAKLKVRYPDKFTESDALNRNLEAERKELEK